MAIERTPDERISVAELLAQHDPNKKRKAQAGFEGRSLPPASEKKRAPHWDLLAALSTLVEENKNDPDFLLSIIHMVPVLITYFQDDAQADWSLYQNATTTQHLLAWRVRNSLIKVPREAETDPSEFFSKEIIFLEAVLNTAKKYNKVQT